MPSQCPFPVRSTDNRRSYRAGSAPGCALALALVVALLGYASLGRAEPVARHGAGVPASSLPSHTDSGQMQARPLTRAT
jgi:hypothetical protein